MNLHWRQYLPSDPADWAQLAVIAIGVYALLRLVRNTAAATILRGTFIFLTIAVFVASFVLRYFELRVLQSILTTVLGTSAFALLIVFQPEIRRALLSLGQHRLVGRFRPKRRSALDAIAKTVETLARERRGGLFAIERTNELQNIAGTGTRLDAEATPQLLISIFWPGSPLHDGGVVIRGDRVVAAGCIFPLAERTNLDSSFGTRHRAGIGLAEQCDAVVVIVSEETGRVSIADGTSFRFVDPSADLVPELAALTGPAPHGPPAAHARAVAP